MLKWVFGADTSPFRRSLNEMRGDVKAFSSSAKSQLAGLFGVGAITAWVSATIDAAGRIDDLSKRLNISAESFQRLSYASKLSGGDVEVVGKALTILTKNLAEAGTGSDTFAQAAKDLNLNLSELSAMSPEAQMIELAKGYAASTDKGAALAAIMKLLGKSGAEIVPMLAEGPEVLAQMLGEATIATNEQIAAMAKMGDRWDAFKMKSVSALGAIIDGFQLMGAAGEYALNRAFGSKDVADKQLQRRRDSIDGVTGGATKPDAKAMAERAAQSSSEVKKIEEERISLSEKLAKLEEDARIKALTLEEKLFDAESRRFKLRKEEFTTSGNQALKAGIERLKVEEEIAGYKKEQADNAKEADDNRKKAADDLNALTDKYAENQRDAKLAGMSDQEKRDFLKKERDQALKDANNKFSSGDKIGGMGSSVKAQELTTQIDDLTKSMREKAEADLKTLQSQSPTIATSSLADIGGGGGAKLMNNDQQRRMVDLLAIIAANTAGGSEGSKPPEPI